MAGEDHRRDRHPQKVRRQRHRDREKGVVNPVVTPDTVLSRDITLLALGEFNALKKCFNI